MKSKSNCEDYAKLIGPFSDFKFHCQKSQLQFLDKNTIELSISDDGGIKIPDIIYQEGLFFISNKFKEILQCEKIDYVNYKKVEIIDHDLGIKEVMFILIPPIIDCLDIDNIDQAIEWDYNQGLVPLLDIQNVKIRSDLIGRFSIFKVFGVLGNFIYITSELYNILNLCDLEAISFSKL